MIDPSYLATLRSQMRAELVLTMMQLDPLVPGWWESRHALGAELGVTGFALGANLSALARKGLVAHAPLNGGSGTFVWWVKRSPIDMPDPALVPAYVVRNITRRLHERIPVNGITQWAAVRGISRSTMGDFLGGRVKKLRNRWELVSTPYDLEVEDVAA